MSKRRKTPELPLRSPTDGERMTAAINWCERERIAVRRSTEYQLTIGPFAFFPDKGRFQIGGAKAGPDRGLRAFKVAYAQWVKEEERDYR